jgi:polar amino acid transport system substrate-binding protein
MARQEGITGLRVVLKMNQAELYLALNKDTPDEVVQRLQKALDELRSEGFVEEMTSSYL